MVAPWGGNLFDFRANKLDPFDYAGPELRRSNYRAEPTWRWISWGSALAALLWLVASVLFSWYAANFGSYNKTYGSLGAVIGFMVWIWLSTVVILLGAEIDAIIDARAEAVARECPGVPSGVIRNLLTARAPACPCSQYLEITAERTG